MPTSPRRSSSTPLLPLQTNAQKHQCSDPTDSERQRLRKKPRARSLSVLLSGKKKSRSILDAYQGTSRKDGIPISLLEERKSTEAGTPHGRPSSAGSFRKSPIVAAAGEAVSVLKKCEQKQKPDTPCQKQSALLAAFAHTLSLPSLTLGATRRKLRVAILDAGRKSVHPAAYSCKVALTKTPWFLSVPLKSIVGERAGALNVGSDHLTRTSGLDSPVEVDLIKGYDIQAGCLGEVKGYSFYDVLVVPGGSAFHYAKLLGEEGRQAVRTFIAKGGGYCGICAGAFLGLRGWKWKSAKGLDIVNAVLVKAGWQEPQMGSVDELLDQVDDAQEIVEEAAKRRRRDAVIVNLRFSKLGRRLLWDEGKSRRFEPDESEDGVVQVRYHNGPLMAVKPDSAARVLATLLPIDPAHSLAVPTGGIVAEDFGCGRAVLISPHPESSHTDQLGHEPGKPRLRRILQRAVLLAASGPGAPNHWLENAGHVPAPLRKNVSK